MNSIHREPEDIFAAPAEEEETEHEEPETLANREEVDQELSAAAALTSLVVSQQTSSSSNNEEEEDEDDDDGDEDVGDDEGMELEIPQRFTKSGRKRAVSFPLKLLKVLSTKKHADVIAWTPSGKAFEIRKPKQFVADILPKYFKGAKYSSFTRKLHRWNFQRHYRGEEAGAFFHKDFMKDRLDLVEQMTCKFGPEGVVAPTVSKSSQKKSKPAAAPTPRKRSTGTSSMKRTNPPSFQSQPIVTVNANQLLQQNGSSLPMAAPRVQPPVVESSPSVDLNAAIELEVARRLEERITAAAFSRQALAMLEQQQQQQQQIQARLNALMEQRYQALMNQQSNLVGRSLAMPPVPTQAPPTLDLAQMYRKLHKPSPSFNYAFGDSTPALPPTNIQGARTA